MMETTLVLPSSAVANERWLSPCLSRRACTLDSATNRSSVRKANVILLGPLDSHYQLVAPLSVSVEIDEEGWYIVSDDLFSQYGDGPTQQQAEDDFRSTLAEYLELVTELAAVSTAQAHELHRLQRYIQSRG